MSRVWHLHRVSVVIAVCLAALLQDAGQAAEVWELTPYGVKIVVDARRCVDKETLEPQLLKTVQQRVSAYVGAGWKLLQASSNDAHLKVPTDIRKLTIECVPEQLRISTELDKLFFVQIRDNPLGGFVVLAREFDVRTQQFGSTVELRAACRQVLGDTVFRAILDVFSPLAIVTGYDPDRKEVLLRLRAGSFAARDPSCDQVKLAQILRPIVRYNDRYGKPRRLVEIPWTLIGITENRAGLLRGKVYSGIRSPLTGRRRGRVEQLALAVRQATGSTRLVFHDEKDPSYPLVGYSVYSHPPGEKETEFLGLTDHRGELVVYPDEKHGVRILLVKHGSRYLARLPIVPGATERLEVPLVNDDPRLKAEAFVRQLQEELVDLVTRRQILLARIQRRLQENDFSAARELFEQLRGLPDRNDFYRQLVLARKRLTSKDPNVQARIDQMFAKTEQLLDQYLDPEVINELTRKLASANASSTF